MTHESSSPDIVEAMELAKNIIFGSQFAATRERNYAKASEYQSYIDIIDAALRATQPAAPTGGECCKGLAPVSECQCEIERKAAGHPPYQRSSAVSASAPDREKVARAIHDGLGGDGWAYTNYGGDEWNDKRSALLDAADAAIALIAPAKSWECMGRKQSLPEPGECSWPDCGCDPHATKVIESLLEQGWGPRHDAQTEPERLSFIDAMSLAERGLEIWKAKDHNTRWWRRIDGTPISNDLLVNIAEEFAKCGLVYASTVSSTTRECPDPQGRWDGWPEPPITSPHRETP